MSLQVQKVLGAGGWRELHATSRRRFGVPPGGPWDRESAQIALAFGGLAPDRTLFELLQGTAELEALEGGTVTAVGMGSIEIGSMTASLGIRVPVVRGDRIRVQAHLAYIAFSPKRLGHARLDWTPARPHRLHYLPQDAREAFLLQVSPASSRAGIRLTGLPAQPVPERPSEPSCVGVIQKTPGGELILIGPDGPTIGGYPKVGVVVVADLNLIPRLQFGQSLALEPVSWDEANRLESESRSRLEQLLRNLQVLV